MRQLTYEEVEQARIEAIAARAADRNRASMGAIVAAVVVGGTGAGPVAAVAVASLAVISQIQFWRNTTQDRENIAAFAENPLTANLDKLQESAVIRVLRSQKESQVKDKPTHDHQPKLPKHSQRPASHRPDSISDTPQQPQFSAPLPTESSLVDSTEGNGAGYVGAVDQLPAIPHPCDDAPNNAPVIGHGFQYHPGVGFVADGLVLRSDESVEPEGDPIVAKYGTTIASITDMHSPASKPRHLALLAVTQCGKSTTVAAIAHALQDRYPKAQFFAVDMKNAKWPQWFTAVAHPGHGDGFNARMVIQTIKAAYDELSHRIDKELKGDRIAYRYFLVLDEWNMTRNNLALKLDKTGMQELDLMVNSIVMQGLEFGVHLIMVLQEPNCDKIGLSDAGRINIHFTALARAGDQTMVDAMLDSSMILKSRQRADQLRGKFYKVWDDSNRHPAAPVIVDSRAYSAEALPDFGGKFNLVKFTNGSPAHDQTPPPQPQPNQRTLPADTPTGTPDATPQDVAPDIVGSAGVQLHGDHRPNPDSVAAPSIPELVLKFRCGFTLDQVHKELNVTKDSPESDRIFEAWKIHNSEKESG